jgi:hypothetical protein
MPEAQQSSAWSALKGLFTAAKSATTDAKNMYQINRITLSLKNYIGNAFIDEETLTFNRIKLNKQIALLAKQNPAVDLSNPGYRQALQDSLIANRNDLLDIPARANHDYNVKVTLKDTEDAREILRAIVQDPNSMIPPAVDYVNPAALNTVPPLHTITPKPPNNSIHNPQHDRKHRPQEPLMPPPLPRADNRPIPALALHRVTYYSLPYPTFL